MSGKKSRQERVDAVKKAMFDVYKNKGEALQSLPFDNERQNRIYAKYYQKIQVTYWSMESRKQELEGVYGKLV